MPNSPTVESKVCVRATVTGTVGITVNGTRFTASADTTVNDGNVAVTITGLLPDKRYTWTLDFDGTDHAMYSGTKGLITLPVTGEVKVGYGSCTSSAETMTYGYYAAGRGYKVFFLLGDTPYLDTGANDTWGVTTVDGSANIDFDSLAPFYERFHKTPGVKYLGERCILIRMWDDHELLGDNHDHTIAQANSGGAGANISAATQNDVDTMFLVCRKVFEAYSLCNPTNADAGVAAQAPFMADAAAANYPAQYFRTTIGDAEFFVTDCISHRGPVAGATRTTESLADADAVMLGSTQRTWLTTRLGASTAINKVWVTTKKTYANNTDNGDGWDYLSTTWPGFVTEREIVLDYVEANVTGFSSISGDRHAQTVVDQSSARGQARDHFNLCACPLGTQQVNSQGSGFNDHVVQITEESCMGELVVTALGITYSLVGTANTVGWTGQILAGSNALSYPEIAIAV